MITTIIFDLGETYINGMMGVEHLLEPILNLKAKDIYPKLHTGDLTSLFHGEITEKEYLKKAINENNWKIGLNQFKKLIRNNFYEIEGVRDIIKELKPNYKLGIISVHVKEWIEHCNKKFQIHKLFHSTLYSFEVGMQKPDIRMYKLMLKRLNVPPEECLFIDDREKNLIPARKLGIITILFKNAKQLRNKLNKLGIKIRNEQQSFI